MTEKELKELFVESNFVYPEKLKGLDLDLAIHNIIESYKTPDHLYRIRRDTTGKLIAHIAFLNLGNKTWIGHHHCSLKRGAGAEVFIDFAVWSLENHGKRIEHCVAIYKRNNKFYEGIYETIGDDKYCNLTKVGYRGLSYPKDETYGLNLSNWHKSDNMDIPPKKGQKIYTKWHFLCKKEALEKSFDFFDNLNVE